MTSVNTQVQPVRSGNGLAVAGMVLGIIALVTFWAIFISAPCGLVGLVLSILGMKKAKKVGSGKGMAITGLVLSILAILATVGLIVLIYLWKDVMHSVDQSWKTIRN